MVCLQLRAVECEAGSDPVTSIVPVVPATATRTTSVTPGNIFTHKHRLLVILARENGKLVKLNAKPFVSREIKTLTIQKTSKTVILI